MSLFLKRSDFNSIKISNQPTNPDPVMLPSVQRVLKPEEGDHSLAPLAFSFGDKKVSQGEFIPRQEAQTAPSITLLLKSQHSTSSDSKAHSLEAGKQYLYINIDLDAPYASMPILAPILHYMQSDLSYTSADGTLESTTPPLVDWAPPRPPPLAGNHRYVSLIYEQPDDFSYGPATGGAWTAATAGGGSVGVPAAVPKEGEKSGGNKVGVAERMRFDLKGFEEKLKGAKLVAGGWFESR